MTVRLPTFAPHRGRFAGASIASLTYMRFRKKSNIVLQARYLEQEQLPTCTFVGEIWVSVCVDEGIFTQSLLYPERSCLDVDQVRARAESRGGVDDARRLPCAQLPRCRSHPHQWDLHQRTG